MELTVQERLKAYKWVIEKNEEFGFPSGICSQLDFYLKCTHRKLWQSSERYKYIFDLFPEFKNQMPNPIRLHKHWFAFDDIGDLQRFYLLLECIEDCKQQLINKNHEHEERVSND